MKTIKTFEEAEKFLVSLIPTDLKLRFTSDIGIKRTEMLLKKLGNPQEKIRVIHIAGTSGKGSTAYLTSLLLHAHGFKVGLHVKPHIEDIRERFQINNELISKEEFIVSLNEVLPHLRKTDNTQYGMLTYFEFVVVLVFYIFTKRKVDYAVIETGVGGLYDATNTVKSKNKIAVLTKIGLDHTAILGNTIEKIAYQKAMIIQKGNIAITIEQKPQATRVIEEVVEKKQARLMYVTKEGNYRNVQISKDKTVFNFSFDLGSSLPINRDRTVKFENLELGLLGSFQAENASLALTTLAFLSKRDNFTLDEKKIREALKIAHFPGRIEVIKVNPTVILVSAAHPGSDSGQARLDSTKQARMTNQKDKTVIIDGAHNPQKMSEFIKNIKHLYPKKKFTFLISFKFDKKIKDIIRYIIPVAERVIITSFFIDSQDTVSSSAPITQIKTEFERLNFKNVETIENQEASLKKALGYKEDIIITGSLYLISQIRPKIIV